MPLGMWYSDGIGTPQTRWREIHHSERDRTNVVRRLQAGEQCQHSFVEPYKYHVQAGGKNVTSSSAVNALSLILSKFANHCDVAL